MTDQVTYGVAADAGRESFARARRAGCSLEEHVVLEAVVSLTALCSKLTNDVAVAVIAERAGLHPKNAARALRRLRDLGVIVYEGGKGRGNVSRVGLVVVETETEATQVVEAETEAVEAPVSEIGERSRSAPAEDADSDAKREPPSPSPSATDATSSGREFDSTERALAEQILELFNRRAGTAYRFDDWGAKIIERSRERPDWTLDDWSDTIRRAFAVAWWEKKRPGEAPTPGVIFSSRRQVDSTRNVADRVVEQSESIRA